ncbi:MAG TPA: ABC transporter permease, partial [Burkholderiales bacterium]|nr:ABC transporter permease [Burkholderiales bacterium]
MTHSGTHTDEALASHLPLRANLAFAARNVLRHKARSATTVLAVLFGVVALILSRGFVEDTFIQLGEAIIHSQTGHLQVAMKGYFAQGAHQPEKYLLPNPETEQREIAAMPGVNDVMARLSFSGLLNNERADYSILGEGIEPEKEAKLGSFLLISAGRKLTGADHYHVLIGSGVAKALKLAPGNRAIVLVSTAGGAMNTLDFEVVGVFQTFSKDYDERVIKIPLSTAQELLATAGANTLVISLDKTSDTDRVARALSERLATQGQEVKTWHELNDFYAKTVDLYNRLFGGLELIILLMV